MKEIELTQGQVAIVDDEDYEYLSQWKWYAHKRHGNFYAQRCEYNPRRIVHMHREILKTTNIKIQVDHKNNDTLLNTRENLREATNSQNQMNRKITSRNTSGYKGVCREGKKWRAGIRHNNKNIPIGIYSDILEAARAYDKKAVELFGEFAKLNFPT